MTPLLRSVLLPLSGPSCRYDTLCPAAGKTAAFTIPLLERIDTSRNEIQGKPWRVTSLQAHTQNKGLSNS